MPPYLPPEHGANDIDRNEVERVSGTVGWRSTKRLVLWEEERVLIE